MRLGQLLANTQRRCPQIGDGTLLENRFAVSVRIDAISVNRMRLGEQRLLCRAGQMTSVSRSASEDQLRRRKELAIQRAQLSGSAAKRLQVGW